MPLKKGKSARAVRILKDRAPKVYENPKKVILMKGSNASQLTQDLMHDIARIKAPFSKMMFKRNEYFPFEDASAIEFLSERNDASLFTFCTSNKKRPHSFVFGRLFDHHILDMIEVGISQYHPYHSFAGPKSMVGLKPLLLFQGSPFEERPDLQVFKNLMLDFFRGEELEKVSLDGLQQLIVFSALGDVICFRSYVIQTQSNSAEEDAHPEVELVPQGPSFDMSIRRTQLASDDLRKTACRIPQIQFAKPKKNIGFDGLGHKTGRLHLNRQDVAQLQTRKVKALKRKRPAAAAASTADRPSKKAATKR